MTTHKDEIVERLRRKAKTASDVQRSMAQAKSLRQEGHDPPRDDLYGWPAPEQTVEWQAADLIEQQASTIERMCWRDIESAPPPIDEKVVFAHFSSDERWNGYADVVKQFQWESMDKPLATGWPQKIRATHWMPLPEPPALTNKERMADPALPPR